MMNLDRDIVEARLLAGAAGTRRSPEGERGDHSAPRPPGSEPLWRHPGPFRPAAVLVPIIERVGGLTVLLTQRAADLADHPGQISFPGGRVEPEDVDAEATALREAREEIGLAARHVRPCGRLDTYETATGFRIFPVVALVSPPFDLAPDPREVAEVFEVPLDYVVDPANHQLRGREWRDQMRWHYVLPYEGRNIWGATAGMLVNLSEILRATPDGD